MAASRCRYQYWSALLICLATLNRCVLGSSAWT